MPLNKEAKLNLLPKLADPMSSLAQECQSLRHPVKSNLTDNATLAC